MLKDCHAGRCWATVFDRRQRPVYDAARQAFREAWGADADMGMGGSIPFIAEFATIFPEATILVTGVEDPGTQAHSINGACTSACSSGRRQPRLSCWRDWEIFPSASRTFLAMNDAVFAFHVVLSYRDRAGFVDDERRPDNALHCLSIELFSPKAPHP